MPSQSTVPPWLSRAFGVGALVAASAVTSSSSALAQQIPIRELAPVDAKTTSYFGNIFSVRQLNDGKVLVNDGLRRQLVVLDNTLGERTVVVDSVSERGQSYGPRAQPLIPYLGDSTLFVDGTSLSLLVIDPSGKISHVMSAPKPADLGNLASSASYVDAKGNLVYRARMMMTLNRSAGTSGPPAPMQPPDSAAIVRADFETRMVDTIGRVKTQSVGRIAMSQDAAGKMQLKTTINPLNTVDEWAVMSDGTIAFVRGHDYHIDFIHPDGSTSSSAKLPFDWKRLTDEDKQGLIDSARTAIEKTVADAKAANPANAARAGAEAGMVAGMAGASGGMSMTIVRIGGDAGGGGASINGGGTPQMTTQSFTSANSVTEFVPLKEIADYYPAIRSGAVKADLDGNLWITPTTSAQSKAGEVICDIVNNRGELTQRVRLPLGRSIAGFGHNGVVYLMYRDGTNGWALERTKVVGNLRATD